MTQEIVLNLYNIKKSFFHVTVLEDISLELHKGEVRALMGENGAGKSTLMKILGGIYTKDSGKIFLNGKEIEINSPLEAREYKICLVHQEISLAENMTITENLFLGAEIKQNGFLDKQTMKKRAQEAIDSLNLNLPADTPTAKLSIAQQQLVEIAKALLFDANIIILDEPTAAISNDEAERLYKKIVELKEKGISFLYITHRMEEIEKVCDTVSVMRDGKLIGTKNIKETNTDEIISMMVGRPLVNLFGDKSRPVGKKTIMEVKNLTTRYIKNVSFELREGEILGFSGLVGAGRTETALALFGIDKIIEGTIKINGREVRIESVNDAVKAGIGLVPEDRKGTGLLMEKSVKYNITLLVLDKLLKNLRKNYKLEKELIDEYSNKLSIKMTSSNQLCKELSGGNQQKIVITKWLVKAPQILIFDEPTRGIDVGAKAEIYHLLNQLAEEGYSIIMISSDLPEVLNMSSRVVVMREGEVTAILDNTKQMLGQEEIMKYSVKELGKHE